jgi:hypothetical protein
MEVVKAFRHIPELRCLERDYRTGARNEFTHQADTVCLWVHLQIFNNSTIVHPIANYLERWQLRGNSQKRDDVGMAQSLPNDNFSIKYLQILAF